MQEEMTKKIYLKLRDELKAKGATLVAVSKNYPFESIAYLYSLGERNFAESRVSELLIKASKAKDYGLTEIAWHFIGHLQKNKIKKLLSVKNLKAIHSVDSLPLLWALLKEAKLIDLREKISLFLEYKTSFEEEKSGLSTEEDLLSCLEFLKEESHPFHLLGLMTMAPIRTESFEEEAKKAFRTLALLGKKYTLKLSMGMSNDYKIALLEGSDFVRIGSLIFDT